MGGDHRVAGPAEQHLEAAYVGPVDVGAVLEGDLLGLEVGALAQPHPRALVGQLAAVGLGAVERGLQHRPGLGEVLAQLAQDRQRRVGGGVVLHVEGHRGAGVAGGAADGARVLQRDLVAPAVDRARQRLAHRRELHRHLGVPGQAALPELREQLEVGRDGRLGLLRVEGVLAEVVERDVHARRRRAGR